MYLWLKKCWQKKSPKFRPERPRLKCWRLPTVNSTRLLRSWMVRHSEKDVLRPVHVRPWKHVLIYGKMIIVTCWLLHRNWLVNIRSTLPVRRLMPTCLTGMPKMRMKLFWHVNMPIQVEVSQPVTGWIKHFSWKKCLVEMLFVHLPLPEVWSMLTRWLMDGWYMKMVLLIIRKILIKIETLVWHNLLSIPLLRFVNRKQWHGYFMTRNQKKVSRDNVMMRKSLHLPDMSGRSIATGAIMPWSKSWTVV